MERVIYLGSDHAGFEMKAEFKKFLGGKSIKFVDLGAFSTDAVDYPDIAREVCEKIIDEKGSLGVLICGTGIGMSMAANKHPGIRAALCTSVEMAQMSRQHNDANVLCLGARIMAMDLAVQVLDTFLNTSFSNEERHVKRIEKIG